MNDLFIGGLEQFGALFLGMAFFISQLGLPVPSIPLLVAAGGLARQDLLDWWSVLSIGLLGVVLGDCSSYVLGRLGGRYVQARFHTNRPVAWSRAHASFLRHAAGALFISRSLVPALDVPTSVLAGGPNHPFSQFLVLSLLCRFIWISGRFFLGYALGVHWPAVASTCTNNIIWVAITGAALASVYILVRHRFRPLF